MHITVFNQHHHNPDCPATCRHYTFLEYLAERHEVSLITSSAWRQLKISDNYNWAPVGVKLYEQNIPYKNSMGTMERSISFARYAGYGMLKGMNIPQTDLIWGISTPLSTPWVAAQVAKWRKVPWVFEVQDLWPSFPIEMGAVKNRWLQQRLYNLELKLYKSAGHIITLSKDMTDYVAAQGISREKISTIVNGTDLDLVKAVRAEEVEELRNKLNLQGKHAVLYAGTYGRANDIPSLIQAAEALADHPSIRFLLTGSGYYEHQLQELAERLPNVLLLPPQPRPDVFKLFQLADLSLVSFNNLPVLATNSPGKFYDSLACGTPVIVTNLGWTKSFVEKYSCGWYVPAEKPAVLAELIKNIFNKPDELIAAGARGKVLAFKQFDRQNLAKEAEQIMLNVYQQR
ncbi:glycosyltransferase family 4 protein [Pontibacter silvestris]|uniref:Glycosyltransferase family 4 protein n=1 Tax=Pontibacter silvestris TaxID=2305183 RepID=A0ABW4WXP3_9BACT|nr:glycosyltransferase family 4 protein [Pontibacter silvestris]MCC9136449.1 glycosyltransferase family 4 protein [Pontibacter silvestris]